MAGAPPFRKDTDILANIIRIVNHFSEHLSLLQSKR